MAIPVTGESFNYLPFILVGVVSAAVIIAAVLLRPKK